jgi:hypothetical protein
MTESGEIEVESPGILEAKLTAVAPEDVPDLSRGVLQLQGQMICTMMTWGAVAVLYRGTELRIFVFKAHGATMEAIIAAAKDFEGRLIGYKHTGLEDWYPVSTPADGAATYPAAQDRTIDLPETAAGYIEDLATGKRMISDGETLVSNATAKLMDIMGEATLGRLGNYLVTWGSRNYKASPQRIVEAKEAYTARNKTLTLREVAK